MLSWSRHWPAARILAAGLASVALILAGCSGTGPAPPAQADPVVTPDANLDAAPVDCPAPDRPKREMRGLWIATISNVDWPSRPGLTPDQQRAELTHLLDEAVRLRLNTVYLQVRPSGDAFYPSPYEPWSAYLTGRQGGEPGYDPLAFAVDAAHQRGLWLHAWINPYRVSTSPDPGRLAPNHPGRVHSDWLRSYGGQLYYDPGIPAVRRLVNDVVADLLTRYDIDGIHLDDYFYPYPVAGQDFPDAATFARYGAGRSRDDWRRDNASALVHELSDTVRAVRPDAVFGISPFGIWRNRSDDPGGSDTAGLRSFDDIYADTRKWVREGWLDYIVPQLYWTIGDRAAGYQTLLNWWADQVAGTSTRLYVGQWIGRIGSGPGWMDPEEMPRHIALDRDRAEVDGEVYFDVSELLNNRLGFTDRLAGDLYATPALVPLPGRDVGAAPAPPEVTVSGQTLAWSDPAPYHAVYRSDGGPGARCAYADPANLVAVVGGGEFTVDPAGDRYQVTAVDRVGHESRPSQPLTVTP